MTKTISEIKINKTLKKQAKANKNDTNTQQNS